MGFLKSFLNRPTDINSNPIAFFSHWFKEALEKEDREVNAFVLSTVNIDNIPSSRVVLLKNIEEKGFVFFTNYNSNKGRDIKLNNYVSMNFFWRQMERQIRIQGKIYKIKEIESDNLIPCPDIITGLDEFFKSLMTSWISISVASGIVSE